MANAAASAVAPCVEIVVEDTPVGLQVLSPAEVHAQLEADAAYAAELQVSLQAVRDEKLIIGPLMESEVHEMLDKVPRGLSNKAVFEIFIPYITVGFGRRRRRMCLARDTPPYSQSW